MLNTVCDSEGADIYNQNTNAFRKEVMNKQRVFEYLCPFYKPLFVNNIRVTCVVLYMCSIDLYGFVLQYIDVHP